MNKKLLVIVSDRISDILRKGEYCERYYNPGNLFEEVHILLTNDDQPNTENLQKTVGKAKLFIHNLPHPSFIQSLGWQFPLLNKWVNSGIELVQKISPALIRCYGLNLNTYLAECIRMNVKIPLIVSLHNDPDSDFSSVSQNIKEVVAQSRAKRVSEKFLDKVDRFIIVYSAIEPYLNKKKFSNYSLIYNVVGIGITPKTDYRVHKEKIKCLCLGKQNINQKDQLPIIEAISRIDKVELHLYGYGDLHDSLVKRVKELNIEDRVIFKEGVSNEILMRDIHSFDIYIYNSLQHEISKSIIEAALCGLPIIHNKPTFKCSEELSEDYIYMVENNPNSYQEALEKLINNQLLREKYGKRAFLHAQKEWLPSVNEQKIVNLYKSFLKTNS